MPSKAFKLAVIFSDIEHILSPAFAHPRRKKLLVDYLRIRTKAFFNRWFHFKKEHFLSYQVEFPDYEIFFVVFRQIFVRHTYYFESSKPNPIVIDCGGNIGMATLYFKYLYPNATIAVFEPSREVYSYIEQNLRKNTLSNITLVNAAVYDTQREMTMYPRGAAASGNTLNKGVSLATNKIASLEPYTVQTIKLSTYVTDTIDFLKLDIEGSEGVVLSELQKTNALRHVMATSMEYHASTDSHENELGEILSLLTSNSFETELYFEDLAPAGLHAPHLPGIRATRNA